MQRASSWLRPRWPRPRSPPSAGPTSRSLSSVSNLFDPKRAGHEFKITPSQACVYGDEWFARYGPPDVGATASLASLRVQLLAFHVARGFQSVDPSGDFLKYCAENGVNAWFSGAAYPDRVADLVRPRTAKEWSEGTCPNNRIFDFVQNTSKEFSTVYGDTLLDMDGLEDTAQAKSLAMRRIHAAVDRFNAATGRKIAKPSEVSVNLHVHMFATYVITYRYKQRTWNAVVCGRTGVVLGLRQFTPGEAGRALVEDLRNGVKRRRELQVDAAQQFAETTRDTIVLLSSYYYRYLKPVCNEDTLRYWARRWIIGPGYANRRAVKGALLYAATPQRERLEFLLDTFDNQWGVYDPRDPDFVPAVAPDSSRLGPVSTFTPKPEPETTESKTEPEPSEQAKPSSAPEGSATSEPPYSTSTDTYEYFDAYRVLGVPRFAKPDQIAKAYRELLRKWHPDLNPNATKEECEVKTQDVVDAFRILSDPQLRREHDDELRDVEAVNRKLAGR